MDGFLMCKCERQLFNHYCKETTEDGEWFCYEYVKGKSNLRLSFSIPRCCHNDFYVIEVPFVHFADIQFLKSDLYLKLCINGYNYEYLA